MANVIKTIVENWSHVFYNFGYYMFNQNGLVTYVYILFIFKV